MLELIGTVWQIKMVEEAILDSETAVCMHDGSVTIKSLFGIREPSRCYSKVYEIALDKDALNSMEAILQSDIAKVRLFYDHRNGLGEVTISAKDKAKLCAYIPDLEALFEKFKLHSIVEDIIIPKTIGNMEPADRT